MKKILTGFLFLMPLMLSAQNQLINNGAIIKVGTGVTFRVNNGGIANKNNGTISNQGNVYLDNNFNQTTGATYAGTAASWLWFEGAANQNATGDATLNIAKLRVDNGNRVILGNHINVTNQVDLTNNGDIELGNFNLVVAPGGTVTGYDANNYVVTNGTGYLQRQVAGTAVVFPVGRNVYNPATLTNGGTVDNFQTRVEDQVRTAYPAGVFETQGMVSKAWFIEEQTVGGSDVTMTLQWETSDELPFFSRAASGIAHWSTPSVIWEHPIVFSAATSVGPTSWTQTRSNINTFSPFAVEDIDLDLPIELLYFDAVRRDAAKVDLDWATASELNNKGFFIERMLDNETSFTALHWVDGFGTTNETTRYQTEDDNAHLGVSYYRLRQVDFDGTETLSEVRAVSGAEDKGVVRVSLYPVPVINVLNVRFGELPKGVVSGEVRIVDVQGRTLFNASVGVQSHQLLQIDEVENWPPGTYMLNIILDNGSTMVEKFVKN